MNIQNTKHIDTRFDFIREHVKEKEVELIHVRTSDQVVDIFAKPLKPNVSHYPWKKLV
jgi:hypothetical protein